jgi:serine/threonine-protein kinase
VLYQMLSGSRPFEAPAKDSARPPAAGDRSAAQRIRRDTPAPLRERAPHVPRSVERIVMRLLEKSPSERYASANDVLERLQRELRALTRDDPASVVRSALVLAGFAPAAKRTEGGAASSSRRPIGARRAIAGHAAVLVAFLVGVLAIEGGSAARGGLEPGNRPLELMPAEAGGLRVLATPWAYVRVDGQQVETTPFARAIPLSTGKHWITLTHPDALPIEREVVITTNETVTLDVTMAVGTAVDAGKDAR